MSALNCQYKGVGGQTLGHNHLQMRIFALISPADYTLSAVGATVLQDCVQ
jgi:hypothetical protein